MKIAVVGSINLDLVVRCERLPIPGQTVIGSGFDRAPGGKGANQALSARRLGVEVRMIGAVGEDDLASAALALLHDAGVDLYSVRRIAKVGVHTGIALIAVGADGENQIVVAPGANAELTGDDVDVGDADAVIAQLEIPEGAVRAAAEQARFFCLNAAPFRPFDVEPDLLVVNQHEHEAVGDRGGLVAVTLGAEGAVLLQDGVEVARADPPKVDAIDTTAAGDAFTACLVVSMLEGRSYDRALGRACAAGALAASRPGAQPSLPTTAQVDAVAAG